MSTSNLLFKNIKFVLDNNVLSSLKNAAPRPVVAKNNIVSPVGNDNNSKDKNDQPSTPPTNTPTIFNNNGKVIIGLKNYSSRTQTPNAIILHYTAGYGSALECVNYIAGRGHGIHYAVDQSGGVVQGVEENIRGIHANNKNSNSIGIEMINIGGLTLKNNTYYTEYNSKYIYKYDTVIDLGYSYLGQRYFQTYSDASISATSNLIDGILRRNPSIKLNFTSDENSIFKNVFGVEEGKPQPGANIWAKKPTINGKVGVDGSVPGIFGHWICNKATHTDPYPHPEIIKMLRYIASPTRTFINSKIGSVFQ
jgi:hypothetical protein